MGNARERFDGKVVLITGAGRGTGRAAAEAFARLGAQVAVNDITPINLDQTVERIRRDGGQVQDFIADVSKQMPVESMVSEVLGKWGHIDALVNAAGVQPHTDLFATDEWDWRHTLDVNLSGPFFAMQIAGRAMQRQGGGAIVNFAASLGSGRPANSAFLASKTGLIGLTQQAAHEFAPSHIRVNAICLPLLDGEAGVWSASAEEAQAEKAARLVVYLCSMAAVDISGQVINVEDWEDR